MRMKCLTNFPWGRLRVRKNPDGNEVLIVSGRTRTRMKRSTELSLGPLVPGENSDDCFF